MLKPFLRKWLGIDQLDACTIHDEHAKTLRVLRWQLAMIESLRTEIKTLCYRIDHLENPNR